MSITPTRTPEREGTPERAPTLKRPLPPPTPAARPIKKLRFTREPMEKNWAPNATIHDQTLSKITALFKKDPLEDFSPIELKIGTQTVKVTEIIKVVSLKWKEPIQIWNSISEIYETGLRIYAVYLVRIEGLSEVSQCILKFLNAKKLAMHAEKLGERYRSSLKELQRETNRRVGYSQPRVEQLRLEVLQYENAKKLAERCRSSVEVLQLEIASNNDDSNPYLDFEILKKEGRLTPDQATHCFHLQKWIPNHNLKQLAICFESVYNGKFVPFETKIDNQTITITKVIKRLGVDKEGVSEGNFADVYLVEVNGLQNVGIARFKDVTQCVFKFPNAIMREKSKRYSKWYRETEVLGPEIIRYTALRKYFPSHLGPYIDFEILIHGGRFTLENLTHNFRIQEFIPDYPIPKESGTLDAEDSVNYKADVQLKNIIKIAYDNELPFDLQRNNLGMNENGIVILRDCVHPETSTDSIHLILDQGLKTFAPEKSERFRFLDPRVNYSPYEKQDESKSKVISET